LCSSSSRKRFSKLIGDSAGVPLYVPYVDPGYTLGARLASQIEEYVARYGKLPAVVLLENHGLFVSAANSASCLRIHHAVTEIGKTWMGGHAVNPRDAKFVVEQGTGAKLNGGAVSPVELRGALLRGGCAPVLVRRDDTAVASAFIAKKGSVAAARQGAFTPDQIVYCRTHPLVLGGDSPDTWKKSVAAYRKQYGVDPRVVLRSSARNAAIPNGIYYAAPDLSQLQVISEVYRGAMTTILRNSAGGGPRFLSRDQARFIEGWEVEKFRATLLAGASRKRTGCIGLVTGAASGLGKALATGLVEAGATVFALDIDRASLEAVSAELPRGRYLPCIADVTDEDSIAAAFRALEASTGGIDFLVNAAGIAPSFALEDFPLDAWKRAMDINLTGYFLCAREAARVLLRQNAGGSIINLSSKSGLEASKQNSAYNATKAGEIHLMRGWALELGRAGIRVNCVAPGNVFKGSRIWNEKYIRACAKKKGIQPKDVIPYYTSLTALNKEIEPKDVVAAVLYLVSEEARRVTGQTLVVDGGQVMVR
jgi:NAD(P)-dependent dehydrogenase (short-subunit alcohol dehydrogenase family)